MLNANYSCNIPNLHLWRLLTGQTPRVLLLHHCLPTWMSPCRIRTIVFQDWIWKSTQSTYSLMYVLATSRKVLYSRAVRDTARQNENSRSNRLLPTSKLNRVQRPRAVSLTLRFPLFLMSSASNALTAHQKMDLARKNLFPVRRKKRKNKQQWLPNLLKSRREATKA